MSDTDYLLYQGAHPMQCPSCNTEMLPVVRSEVEIDHCPKCEGIWLDRGELEKLIERAPEVNPKPNDLVVDIFWDVFYTP